MMDGWGYFHCFVWKSISAETLKHTYRGRLKNKENGNNFQIKLAFSHMSPACIICNIYVSYSDQKHIPVVSLCTQRTLPASTEETVLFSHLFFIWNWSHIGMPMKNTDFTLVQLGEKDPMRQKDTSTGRTGQERRGGETHSVSFEPVSPCWAEFDIQTMRQGSTQGGRPPCNINSHLESSCGYEHETLKETAAMDPVPSHHHSHCLLKRPPHCSLKPAWKNNKPALIPHVICLLTAVSEWLSVSLWGLNGLRDVANIWRRKSALKASLSQNSVVC